MLWAHCKPPANLQEGGELLGVAQGGGQPFPIQIVSQGPSASFKNNLFHTSPGRFLRPPFLGSSYYSTGLPFQNPEGIPYTENIPVPKAAWIPSPLASRWHK